MDFGSLFIPPELLAGIIQVTPVRDIKTLRRVCRVLNDFAAPFLFRELYISNNLMDREIFTAVSKHPVFSKSVQKVVYDATNISPVDVVESIRMNRASYTRFFYAGGYRRGGKEYSKAAIRRGYGTFEASYKQQIELAEYSGDELTHPKDRETRPNDFSSLLENPDRFSEVKIFLPDDLVRLVEGLPRMPNVKRFEISDCRHTRNLRRYRHRYPDGDIDSFKDITFSIQNEGTRGVDQVVMDPRPWPSSYEEYGVTGWGLSWYRGFYVLTQAASITRMKTLESLEVQRDCKASGLTLQIFNLQLRQLFHTTNVFAHLKSIKLKIHALYAGHERPPPGLSKVLASAKQLEFLDIRLDLTSIPMEGEETIEFEKIFGEIYWPDLRQATLGYLALTETPFLNFFIRHRRTLRSLRLEQVFLPGEPVLISPQISSKWGRILQSMALDDSTLTSFTLRSDGLELPHPAYLHCCDATEMNDFLKSGYHGNLSYHCPRREDHLWDEEDGYL